MAVLRQPPQGETPPRTPARARPFSSGEGVSVRFSAFYALFLEGGAKGPGARVMAPRTFLSRALDLRHSMIRRTGVLISP